MSGDITFTDNKGGGETKLRGSKILPAIANIKHLLVKPSRAGYILHYDCKCVKKIGGQNEEKLFQSIKIYINCFFLFIKCSLVI